MAMPQSTCPVCFVALLPPDPIAAHPDWGTGRRCLGSGAAVPAWLELDALPASATSSWTALRTLMGAPELGWAGLWSRLDDQITASSA